MIAAVLAGSTDGGQRPLYAKHGASAAIVPLQAARQRNVDGPRSGKDRFAERQLDAAKARLDAAFIILNPGEHVRRDPVDGASNQFTERARCSLSSNA
jgi:hypothetical protein